MSVIYPGNYVAHLNAYKDQGVEALPGVEFYRVVGVYVCPTTTTAAGALALVIPSPDQRQDDKPRLDRNMVIPAGATIYRTAVNTVNLSSTGSATIQATGISGGTTLTASSGVFPDGATSSFDLSGSLSALGSDTAVTATASADLTVVDPSDAAAVIVEVCYYKDAPAPDVEDVHIPYKTEAGQGY